MCDEGRAAEPPASPQPCTTARSFRETLFGSTGEDLVGRNVAKLVQLSTTERPEVRVLSVDEGRALLRSAREDRLFAGMVLLMLLGLRRSKLLGLRWSDLDLERGVLQVRQGLHYVAGELVLLPPKTRRSRQSLPLPGLCADALRAHQVRMVAERATSLVDWPENGLVFVTTVGTLEPRPPTRPSASRVLTSPSDR